MFLRNERYTAAARFATIAEWPLSRVVDTFLDGWSPAALAEASNAPRLPGTLAYCDEVLFQEAHLGLVDQTPALADAVLRVSDPAQPRSCCRGEARVLIEILYSAC